MKVVYLFANLFYQYIYKKKTVKLNQKLAILKAGCSVLPLCLWYPVWYLLAHDVGMRPHFLI